MKKPNKSFALVCLLNLLFCYTAFSQNKTSSIMFDKYSEESGTNLNLLAEKTKRFAKHLQKLPKSTKGVIIYYLKADEEDFISGKKFSSEERNDYVRNLLIENYGILSSRIVSKRSAYRISNEIEFWIQPRNAAFPKDTPKMYVDCFCPEIKIDGSKVVDDKTEPQFFSVSIIGGSAENISYKWKVSDGEIIGGQGRSVIKVDLTKVNTNEISATVKIDGICGDFCPNIVSFTTKIK
ncbi:MAG TPA: hypothetical protein VGD05_08810 [Pyrinomonadaceae bacterium]|jgi:hypothetical protein